VKYKTKKIHIFNTGTTGAVDERVSRFYIVKTFVFAHSVTQRKERKKGSCSAV